MTLRNISKAYKDYLIRSNYLGEMWIEKDSRFISWANTLEDAKIIINGLTA